jgi:large subunit ribosomal protein L33
MRQEHSGRGQGRVPVTLACSECKARNYKTTKSLVDAGSTGRSREEGEPGESGGAGKALEIKKYCKVCKRHTLHRETK